MLIQSSLPSSIEAALFCVSNHGLQDVLCNWVPGAETWQMCTKCDFHCSCRKAQLNSKENKNTDDLPSLLFPRSSSQLSAVSIMSESSAPNLVYKRRKLRGNSVTIFSEDRGNTRTGDYLSFVNFNVPSEDRENTRTGKKQLVDSQIEHETKATRVSPHLCNRESHVLNSESFNGCSVGGELISDEAPKNNVQKVLEANSVNDSCSSSKSNMEHLSAVRIMSESSAPNLVYKRKKLGGNSVTIFSEDRENTRTGDYRSFVNFIVPSIAAKKQLVDLHIEHETKATRASPHLCNRESHVLSSESFNGCSVGEELVSDEALKNNVRKVLEVNSVNDSCSSSKSNMEHASTSMKTEVDENGECSSSSVIVMEAVGDLSEKDLCISILRSHGLLGDVQATRICRSAEDTGTSCSDSCHRSCKICSRAGTALKMLICDNCEEAFHMSCCHPRIKKVPFDEWFCHSCLRKKQILKEKVARKSPNITSVMCRNASSKGQVNPILLMLRDSEPYATSVRFGKGYQAEVPDWSGPINDDIDGIGEPLELDSSEYVRLNELNCNKPSRVSSIGNWLQCREVVDSANGTICGKWRRAPLFEVQTDDWECFCSILWDPSHADCNVPQVDISLTVFMVLKCAHIFATARFCGLHHSIPTQASIA
ncbi:unnamed protein product [Prunus armeniaca]|uniref:PHD-type domain-containing protein n=1 Tax=Prunus armeniaca TaxID=36596 RepID=A0A6J5VTR6_PRUAR|nr:unnamed protein product [Prunus armeniaca]